MWLEFLAGAWHTLLLALLAWLIGLPVGFVTAWLTLSVRWVRNAVSISAIGMTVIPLLAILFWLHYPLQMVLGVVWSPYFTATCLMSVYVLVLVADILSSELIRLDDEYAEIALVLGLTPWQFTSRVLLLGAVERGLPRLLSLAVISVHMTMFASLIGVEELFRVTQRLNAQFLRPVELYTVMAICYAMLCIPLHLFAIRLGHRLRDTQDA